MPFPSIRLRRLRANSLVRTRLAETELSPRRLLAPFFVCEGRQVRRPIPSMPGQFQMSVDILVHEAGKLRRRGIPSLLLFGIPKKKDLLGTQAYAAQGIVQKALRALKKAYPDLLLA